MISSFRVNRTAAIIAGCLAFFAQPALAVINQTVEFPDAQSIQGATLSLANTDQVIEGEVREEDDRKFVVFVLPDDYQGRDATANVVVDNVPRSYPIVIGAGTPTFHTPDRRSSSDPLGGSFYYGIGAGIGSLSTDFPSALAQQSATDAVGLLGELGLVNTAPTMAADDSAFAWDGILELGYMFADESRLSIDFRTGSVNDFDLSAGASGDVPMSTSVVTAQSVATAGLDTWSTNLNYGRFFSPTSNWGFQVSLGHQAIDRPTFFTSTISADGVPLDSMSGDEELDDSVIQYGVGLEWTKREARGWIPTVGVRVTQSGNVDILDGEKISRYEAYFTFRRRADGQLFD